MSLSDAFKWRTRNLEEELEDMNLETEESGIAFREKLEKKLNSPVTTALYGIGESLEKIGL